MVLLLSTDNTSLYMLGWSYLYQLICRLATSCYHLATSELLLPFVTWFDVITQSMTKDTAIFEIHTILYIDFIGSYLSNEAQACCTSCFKMLTYSSLDADLKLQNDI